MNKILISNDVNLDTNSLTTLIKAAQIYLNTFALDWGIEPVELSTDNTHFDMKINISNKFRHLGASGYHTVENGIPVSYVIPTTSYNYFGRYRKAWFIKGRQILCESYRPGLLTTITHEIMEALIDPHNDRYSVPDSLGRCWRMEVGDHCYGSYSAISVDGYKCVMPDYTLPSFYSLTGTPTFTKLNAVRQPFTLTDKGYGYWLDKSGRLVKL